MLVALLMGFSGGLPLLLTMGVLQAWMKEGGVDLTWIGMITLVQIPYTWKFSFNVPDCIDGFNRGTGLF
jgi:PAT family beta-lactamase induction signal transducer AmpG